MRWFLLAFKNIFNYSGRARRAEYGWFFLTNFLLQIGVMLLVWLVAFIFITFFVSNASSFSEDSLAAFLWGRGLFQ
ncbi:hypothetical protein A4G19_07000 [Pasteurellaceae bacterium Macca]|nr:hypothetical protein [Pasteurellaceae bacterium Macca]